MLLYDTDALSLCLEKMLFNILYLFMNIIYALHEYYIAIHFMYSLI